jgi:hypothetical protein
VEELFFGIKGPYDVGMVTVTPLGVNVGSVGFVNLDISLHAVTILTNQ